jgi:serine/threonine-protein kinase
VATREQLEKSTVDARPRPAAGMPPSQVPMSAPTMGMPQQGMPQHGMPTQAMPPQGMSPQGMPGPYGPQSAYGTNGPMNGPGYGYQQQQPPPSNYPPQRDERTAAFPSPENNLGSTVALPSGAEPPRAAMMQAGMGYPQQQQQQGYGQQQMQQQPFGAPVSYQQGGPMMGQQMPPGYAIAPQSQIETALSLPRPDPAALWLAQQEKQKGERRNTGLFIAIVALTALCVIAASAILYLTFTRRNRQAQQQATVEATSAPVVSAAPIATGAATAAPEASATAAPEPSVSATAAPDKPEKVEKPEKADKPERAERPSPGVRTERPPVEKAAPAEKEEPGFLTIVCNPYCDEVIDQGRSLGQSPVVHLAVKPGQHRITLKKDGQSKVISLIVVSGQVTAQRISMAK